ncbi:MAG: VWA domain-containing protein [Actinomycetota bacterium]|nr:VWA domain-containing protein [Actinomycetota bacterium]
MTTSTHIYFVLDRSGSMQSIASDVIGGFNGFVAAQRANGDDAVMTVVQFDTQDPHEVLGGARPIAAVAELSAATYLPRSGTPLYDAMGHTIADATIRVEQRRAAGLDAEEIIFVTFTDGHENQSVEYTRQMIFDLMKKRQDDEWTFA